MNVRMSLQCVTLMLSAVILMAATCVSVHLDTLEMEPHALVSANVSNIHFSLYIILNITLLLVCAFYLYI